MRLYLSSLRLGNRPEELLRLLDGRKRTALIVNAADYKGPRERALSVQHEIADLEGISLEPVEVDLREYFGRSDELRQALTSYDLIYVRGGNVFILRRAFRQSGADNIVTELLAHDAVVYGGYSAGPCILGPTLRGLEGDEDDPHLVPEGYAGEVVWEGLSVLPFAIAPHYNQSSAWSRRVVDYYTSRQIPFVALRDGQVLVIEGDAQTVVG